MWGTYGSAPGQFNMPNGVAIASNDTVYVVDILNFRLQYFTTAGSFLGSSGVQEARETASSTSSWAWTSPLTATYT